MALSTREYQAMQTILPRPRFLSIRLFSLSVITCYNFSLCGSLSEGRLYRPSLSPISSPGAIANGHRLESLTPVHSSHYSSYDVHKLFAGLLLLRGLRPLPGTEFLSSIMQASSQYYSLPCSVSRPSLPSSPHELKGLAPRVPSRELAFCVF
jgi:hypothetical protein